MRDYIDIPILKGIRAEDIEDVSERYVPLFTAEREADTVKRVRLSDTQSLFFISLIEHKTEVDYNVVMQLLRYMSYIWEDYEKEAARQNQPCGRKDFRYPPILPIVYYEGKGEWTAVTNFKDRIFLNDVFAKYVPDFCYELVRLHEGVISRIKERKMPELFEHFKGYDVQETRREARQEGREEGRKEGERRLLVAMVCKKLRRGQGISEIAGALETEESVVEYICGSAMKYAPDYDEDKIYVECYGESSDE